MILGNQRGAALLMTAVIVVLLFLILAQSLTTQMSTEMQESARIKRTLVGISAMQQFAIMAQAARQKWSTRTAAPGPACDSGYHPLPTSTSEFCWPDSGGSNHQDCIQYPLSDAASPIWLCLSDATKLQVAAWEPDHAPGFWDKMQSKFYAWSRRAREHIGSYVAGLNNLAHAQASYLPTDFASAPTSGFTSGPPTSCSATGPSDTYCKFCGGGSPNVHCVTLKACLRDVGTCTSDEWISQTVGIIDRDTP